MNEKLKRDFEAKVSHMVEFERASTNDVVALSLDLFLIIREQDEMISKLRAVLESRTGPIFG